MEMGKIMKVRKIKIAIIAVFLVLIFGVSVITVFVPQKKYSVTENRKLALRPKFKKEEFLHGKYQTGYENFLNDQFVLRDRWVDISTKIQKLSGKKDMNGVYLGKKGYLLEKPQKEEFDAEQEKENEEILSLFLNYAVKEYGKNHVSCLMIPSKTTALSEYLPAFADTMFFDDVMKSISKKLDDKDVLIDLKKEMSSHKEEYIYYRTDHHWTTLGAYYAYQKWADITGQGRKKEITEYKREEVFNDFYGTTYNKIHQKTTPDIVEIFHNSIEKNITVNFDNGDKKADTLYFKEHAKKGFNRYELFLGGNTFQIEINTKAHTGKTLLLIKDSFANCFVPFLAEDYDKIIMIDYRYGKKDIGKIMGEQENITDVLVLFNTEKFLKNTKLKKLGNVEKKKDTMKEFNIDDLF